MVLLKLLEFGFVEGGLIVPKVDILIPMPYIEICY